jgi:hypothetical protein
MGVPTSEVGYTSATTRRETTKSIWTCGGIGKQQQQQLLIRSAYQDGNCMFMNVDSA